jgi:UDP-N-acetylglucosamine 2-epimerase (non-hydrolysing)
VLIFVFGTQAELYKLAPVLEYFRNQERREIALLFTGQQELRPEDESLTHVPIQRLFPTDYHIAKNNRLALKWAINTVIALRKRLRKIANSSLTSSSVVVHGDTISTALGAIVAKSLRLRLSHVEAGLRSNNLLSPFPEEIVRILVSRLADLHFAPGAAAVNNLKSSSGEIVDTRYNTALDFFAQSVRTDLASAPTPPFFLVSLHRYELMSNGRALSDIFRALSARNFGMSGVFILDSMAIRGLTRHNLWSVLLSPQHVLLPKLPPSGFHGLLERAEFLVTDSGGQQEEAAYMGIPCLLLRNETERQDGLGENVVLGGMSAKSVSLFVSNFHSYRRDPKKLMIAPSEVIAGRLRSLLSGV